MKKIIYYLVFILLFYSNTNSQIIWNQQYSGTYENLNDVYFPDVNTGYAVGNNGIVLKTTNLGQNWVFKNLPVVTKNYSVYFQSADVGFVGNEDYNLYKTTDGGNTWNTKLTAANYAITSIYFSSALIGWVGDRYGNIQKTTNGGDNWFTLVNLPGYDAKVFFNNDLRGWGIDTYGFVYTTTNSGATFTSVRPSNDTLSGIYFLSSTLGFVAGDSGRVYRSTNGGLNWALLNTGTTVKLKSVYASNANFIIAAGYAGTILYSFDGGDNWSVETITTNNINSFNFIPNTLYGCAVGNVGTILKTNNSGVWCVGNGTTQVSYPFFTYFEDSRTDMLFLASELYANGVTPGNIYSIGFQVATVSTQVMNGFNVKFQTTSLTAITGFTNTGWTTAFSGTYTVPGTGLQYIQLNAPYFYWSGSGNLLVEICFNNNSWTANSNVNSSPATNMVYHNHVDLPTGDGCVDITTGTVQTTRPNTCFVTQLINGEKNVNNNIPEKFSLSQNYPNPFNPVTKIKYTVPKNSFVTLKVFDIIGREIRTLVNEEKSPGEYIIDFDASNLPSGVYFYKIFSDKFSDVKRMILVK